MDLNTWLIILAAIIIILIIIKVIFKTVKIILFVGFALVVTVLLYGYYQPVENGYEGLSIYDCKFDNECMYVVNASDCILVAGKCNNMIKMENYVVDGKMCNKEGIVVNENVTCKCITGEDLNYCEMV